MALLDGSRLLCGIDLFDEGEWPIALALFPLFSRDLVWKENLGQEEANSSFPGILPRGCFCSLYL